jgi:hypothetical protein
MEKRDRQVGMLDREKTSCAQVFDCVYKTY